MRDVAERFPDDLDVQTLCAESEMNVHAWKLWTADGQPVAGRCRSKSGSSRCCSAVRPPGRESLLHSCHGASPDPGKALASAERLRGMMPAAGHLEHMPAHIMQRVGRYEDAAEANRRAWRPMRRTSAPPRRRLLPHVSRSQLRVSRVLAAMEGRKAETLAAVQSVLQTIPST